MLPIYFFFFLFFISLLSLIPSCSAKGMRLLGIVGGIGTMIGIGYLIQGPLFGFPQMWQGTYWVIDQFAALLTLLIGFLYLAASFVSYRYLNEEQKHGV